MTSLHPLVARYGDPLAVVDEMPRNATELYRTWAHVPDEKPIYRRERNERRWLAYELERLARRRIIHRDITPVNDGHRITFWREMDPADQGRGRSRLQGEDAQVRAVGRVGQPAD